MSKFMPGDRARYVNHGLSIYGTVDRYNTAGDVVLRQDNGNFLTAAENSFELAEPEMPFSPNADVVIQREMPQAAASALEVQEGGSHYKDMRIQPIEFIHANGIPFAEGSIIKYVARWRTKNGIQDLKKARHFLDLLIELEEKNNA